MCIRDRSWTAAEAECQKEGGHLASVASKEVDDELYRVGRSSWFWLGGKQESSVLSWSDNSTWGYTNWDRDPGSSGDDFFIKKSWYDGTWYASTSSDSSFICQLASSSLRGKEKLDLTYKKDQLTFRSFLMWYQFKAVSQ